MQNTEDSLFTSEISLTKVAFLEVWPFSNQSKLFRRALVDWKSKLKSKLETEI